MPRSRFHIKLAVCWSLAVAAVRAIDIANAEEIKPFGQLLNVSARLHTGTGDNVLIGGFIINGTAPKKTIVRVIGPTLAAYGVSGVLADPMVELHDHTGALIATNDNWKDTQQSQ